MNIFERYILKGLINNPNCTSVIKDKITVLLEDKEKYPTECDQYELQFTSTCFITGELTDSVSIHSVAEAIINGGDWEDYIESTDSDWRDYARDDAYGPTTLVDWVIYLAFLRSISSFSAVPVDQLPFQYWYFRRVSSE